jgi:16S rRNA processing protein RimM
MAEPARVLVGEIVGAQGIGGQLRVRSFTQDPADLVAYGPLTAEPPLLEQAGGPLKLVLDRVAKGGVVILRTPGVKDRTAAERLKGTKLYLDRSQLPAPEPDEFYHADLIGLAVELRTGERLGVVTAVQDYGAGPILEVGHGRGSTLLPFTRAVVPEVDLKGGRLVAEPPPGLIPKPADGGRG